MPPLASLAASFVMRSILESLAGTGGSWRLIAAILGIALITIYLDREARR